MITGVIARVAGPAATLFLLAALAAWPPEYTATYAVLMAYLQLATAPLNPYSEHFHLREIMNGRPRGLGAGLVALALIWMAALVLLVFMGHSWVILVILPVLGLGHLMLKVQAAQLRAKKRNTIAIALEFSLRPMLLLVGTLAVFAAFGASEIGLEAAFGLSGLATILIALQLRRATSADTRNGAIAPEPEDSKQAGTFLFLGTLMVLATQFEVFALDKVGTASDLGTYKVALQLASVCGIATNFVLINKLRDLYADDFGGDAYRRTFRGIQKQTLGISLIFMLAFAGVAQVHPLIWARDTWTLAAAAAAIFSISAAFGPLANWFFAAKRPRAVIASLLLMVGVKVLLFVALRLADAVSPFTLMSVYGAGLLTQNAFLLALRRRASR